MGASSRRSAFAIAAATAALIAFALPASAETDDAIARLLAEVTAQERGSGSRSGTEHEVQPAERPRPEDERRLMDEIEMLERARAEAEARRPVPPPTATTAATPQPGEPRGTIEKQPRAAETQAREDALRRSEDAARKAEDEHAAAEARRIAEDANYARLEAEREAEAIQIDEALRKAREARAQRQNARLAPVPIPPDAPRGGTTATIPSSPAIVEASPSPVGDRTRPRYGSYDHAARPDAHVDDTRVTVLIVLEPGARGIRRHNRTADPLLCGEKGCYISTGAAAAADFLQRRRAFGLQRTFGERAGACSNSLGCVFRGVELVAYPAALQPVDMRLLRHDRREPHILDEASRCRLDGGRLSCTPVFGRDYVMWIVPERIAERAGPRELQRVVEGGLRSKSASIDLRD